MTFESLSHVLRIWTLSFLYVNDLEGYAHLSKTLTSKFRMKIKPQPEIVLDKNRPYMTPLPLSRA